jgi:hypothetical protein
MQTIRELSGELASTEHHEKLLREVREARVQLLLTRAQSDALGELHRRMMENSRRMLERSRVLLARTRPHRPFE